MSPVDAVRSHPGTLRVGTWIALLGVLALLVGRLGAGPFVAGLRHLTPGAVVSALGLTALATVAGAIRWSVIAHALDEPLPLRAAIGGYAGSQLLNTVLPGGVAGDVARGLETRSGARMRRLRTVGWDRGVGQVVQLVLLAATAWALVPWPIVAGAVGLVTIGVLLARRTVSPIGDRVRRAVASLSGDAHVLIRRRIAPVLVATSVVVTLSHAVVFVIAAEITGTAATPFELLPIALAVQAATVVPSGFGGFGVREGSAAALFAAAGFGAAHGVEAGIAAGALALMGVLPGVVPLLVRRVRVGGRTPRRLVLR